MIFFGGGKLKFIKLINKLRQNGDFDTRKTNINRHRSHIAIVNGNLLTGKNVHSYRIFHNSPKSAAKKVLESLHKGYKNKEGQHTKPINILGINNAVEIELIEITDGVVKVNGKNYKYGPYYGWREILQKPKSIIKLKKKNYQKRC